MALNINSLVNVQVVLSAQAAQGQNLNTLMIVGDSNIIPVTERVHFYTSIDDVAGEFGLNAPEYKAAQLYFAQIPQPARLGIARWGSVAYAGSVIGGATTSNLQTYLQTITSGAWNFNITIDNVVRSVVASLTELSAVTSLVGVATLLQSKLSGVATIQWDANFSRFFIQSNTVGISSNVGFAVPQANDFGAVNLKLTAGTGATVSTGGNPETITTAVNTILGTYANDFLGLSLATNASVTDTDLFNIASIFAADQSHIFGITTSNPAALDPNNTTDIGSLLAAANNNYAAVQYSTSSPYAIASFFGRALTVDYRGNNTVITLMYKGEPLVFAENLNASQALALRNKNINVLASYDASPTVAIIQFGTTANEFFDTVQGLIWLKNEVQLRTFNLLYTGTTKVPQTSDGVQLIVGAVESACAQGVVNGLLAPGIWNAPGFGTLRQGDYVPKGYYVYANPINTQSQADREARISPLIQVAVKLAGAIHTVNVIINVNR